MLAFLFYGGGVNFLPSAGRRERFSRRARISPSASLRGKIFAPTPEYVEMSGDAKVGNLVAFPRKFVLVEQGVRKKTVFCPAHSVLTGTRTFRGKKRQQKTLTISVDLEGSVALSHVSREEWEIYEKQRDSLNAARKLARVFLRYRMPVTWGICGHLFLEGCDGRHGYSENDWYGPWFKHDPATEASRDSSWYMPDFIRFLTQESLFEIGYHSFGHFRYQQCSEKTVERDMAFADSLRRDWGIKLESFVFPYNQCGHLDLVVARGRFRCIRGNIGNVYPAFGILDFGDFRFFNTTQMFSPETMDVCLAQIEQIGRHTFNYYTHAHQWLQEDAWEKLEEWLHRLDRVREAGTIRIRKMGEVA